MTQKQVVENYIEGFNAGDHPKILSCLTQNVEWIMPGVYRKEGIAEFAGEIQNAAFTGLPVITITRLVEEGNIVVAEGAVTCQLKTGPILNLEFCDVFHFENGLISQLTSYIMQVSQHNPNE
jgi:ketosteroid isomerase-like protein